MLHSCALISSSRSFHLVLGLWCYIMWHVIWLQYHVPLHRLKEKEKKRKRKIVSVQAFHNSTPLLGFYFQKNFFFILSDPLTHLLIPLIPFQTFFQLLHIFVKIAEGGLNFYFSFHFIFIFLFIFDLFSIFRTRIRVKWQRSHGHMT